MIVGIDTCGATGTVALAQWREGVASLMTQTELAGKTYSAQLIPKINELLDGQRVRLKDIEAIVVDDEDRIHTSKNIRLT